ncbi:hypothetical protein KUL118_52000 [Tenacibaculum sp. KUL118]|nr:hypothetical protein KUL118_52000 [Tenacibaculum sp. KUL118]
MSLACAALEKAKVDAAITREVLTIFNMVKFLRLICLSVRALVDNKYAARKTCSEITGYLF